MRAPMWVKRDNLAKARAEKNWMVKDLAREIKMSYINTVKVTNGTSPTTIFTAHKISMALGKKMEYLFEKR